MSPKIPKSCNSRTFVKSERILSRNFTILHQSKEIGQGWNVRDFFPNGESGVFCGFNIIDEDIQDKIKRTYETMKLPHEYYEQVRTLVGKKYELEREITFVLLSSWHELLGRFVNGKYIPNIHDILDVRRKAWIIDENEKRYALQLEVPFCLGLFDHFGRTNEFRFLYVGKDGSVGYFVKGCEILEKNVIEENEPDFIYPNLKVEIGPDFTLMRK